MDDRNCIDLAHASVEEVRRDWDTFYGGVERRLVMAIAMAEPDGRDGSLEEQLLRLRIHNHEALRVIRASAANGGLAGPVVKFLRAGVLVTVDPGSAAAAATAAVTIMKAFDDGPGSMWDIRPMIGIAVGDVIDLAGDGPPDPQGGAVDQAVRFIYEIATPKQILVEATLLKPDVLDEGLTLVPLEGKQKSMVGAPGPVLVSELVWRDANAPITNRWRLNDDLLRIQRAALEVLTEMNALQWDHRANIYKPTLDDGEIDRFKRQVKGLDRSALRRLDEVWAAADEAQDDDALRSFVEDVRATYQKVLEAFNSYLGTSSQKSGAVSELRNTWSTFEDAVDALSDQVQVKMQKLRMSHV